MSIRNLQYALNANVRCLQDRIALIAIVSQIEDDGYSRFDLHELSDLLGLRVPEADDVLSRLYSARAINSVYYDKALNATIFIEHFAPKERTNSRVPLNPVLRTDILEQDGYESVECGSRHRLEVDHMLPVSRGGTDVESNMQTLCKTCNSSKGAKTMQEWHEWKASR